MSVAYIPSAGGVCARPAGWRVLTDPARPASLKAAGARFSCSPWQGHIVAAARLQLVRILQYARQHAMHAERDIVIQFRSVCLSVCLTSAVMMTKVMDTSSLFDGLVRTSF